MTFSAKAAAWGDSIQGRGGKTVWGSVFWGPAIAAWLCAPALAGPATPVPGFETLSPPRVVLRPVEPRAMTPATRARLERQRQGNRDRRDGVAIGGYGSAFSLYSAPPADVAGAPPVAPYVILGPPRPTTCIGPGPLIIEVGKPLPTPANLPRVVYGTPAPPCPRS